MPYLLLILAPLFWSGNFVVARGIHEIVPPVGLAFWRWTLALIIFLPFTLAFSSLLCYFLSLKA